MNLIELCHYVKFKSRKVRVKMSDKEILEKVLQRRGKGKSNKKIIISLEKEIDYLREEIKRTTEDDELVSFKVTKNMKAEQLYKFLFRYVPMGEVIDLYKYLKRAMKV